MSMLEKLKKNSTIKLSSALSESDFFKEQDMVQTSVPAINIALSGSLDGGLTPGLTMFAGASKNFKTGFSLLLAKSYLEAHPESVLLFYDSEFGTPQSYFDSFNIDKDRVLHTPVTDIEELKFDIMRQLDIIKRNDKVIIIIDSVGNIASKKEVEDALNEKSVADMSRAKQLKSLFRMVTPHLTIKNIPMVVINHTYKEQGLFPKDIVSGGTGSMYSSSAVFIIGRRQEKTGTEVTGYDFVINVEKSRYVREKSKIPISVSFEGGISKWSGLIEIAIEGGFVHKPKNGWYARTNLETGEIEEKNWRLKDTNTSTFWDPIISSVEFREYINRKYKIGYGDIMKENEIEEFLGEE